LCEHDKEKRFCKVRAVQSIDKKMLDVVIIAAGTPAGTTGAPASAGMTARGAGARTAGAPASASINVRGASQCRDCGGEGMCARRRHVRTGPQPGRE
jgi:hypothetical protein